MNTYERGLGQLLIIMIMGQSMMAQFPSTQIYTLDLKVNETKVLLDNVQFLTDFNQEGYNNQPHFIDNENLLISSDWKAEALTDVWHLDLKENEINRITATAAGEFSPTVQSDGMNISVIRQTMDAEDRPIQVLWSYPMDRSGGGASIVLDPATIGYHTWLSPELVALYLVGEPNELVLYNIKTKASKHIAYSIGRALKTTKNGDLLFIQKTASSFHIRKYNPTTRQSTLVTTALSGQEDFDVLPNGFLIAGSGTKLMIHRPLLDQGWKEVLDLSSIGINQISRIASAHNKIAIVTSK